MRVWHVERVGERLQRPAAGERQDGSGLLLAVMVLGVPGDVLAEPLVAAAAQVHDGGHAGEASRHRLLEPLELVDLDLERGWAEALP